MYYDLNELSLEQRIPVMDTEGAVLVTAGAGSGKTRVLTHRIAHLINDKGVYPYNVLAITFTNKAAGEMKNRLSSMLGEFVEGVWISTFHSLCLKILRKYIGELGSHRSDFSVWGEDEKEHCIKRILKSIGEKNDEKDEKIKEYVKAISDSKNNGLSPSEYRERNSFRANVEKISNVYNQYLKECILNNAMDYDDLLLNARALLLKSEIARDYYQNRFKYIHVDEFQDTNGIQYDLIKILSAKHKNIFVVGDEDQSIYGWRGANVDNIFYFQKDFSCKLYKLEQNYRSSAPIIELANNVIKHNQKRLEKKLWTSSVGGEKVVCYGANTEGDEADFVMQKISYLMDIFKYKLSDFAILMRVNSLSRSFEERFIQYGIPHRVYGGFKFYDRKEIKDVLAYLKILSNPYDSEALCRIINFPKRGIGESTISQLREYAQTEKKSMYEVILNIANNDVLPKSLVKKVQTFSAVLNELEIVKKRTCSVYELLRETIKISGIKNEYADDTEENEMRRNNIRELASGVKQFEEINPGGGLDEYLQQISLYSDLDEMSESNEMVSIATIHSAKGLEFKVVFVVGLEEQLFPDGRRTDNANEMEEERRLMYVAVTRARERLYLSYARSRYRFGQRNYTIPSRFFKECGYEIKNVRETMYGYNNSYGYGNSYSYGGRSENYGENSWKENKIYSEESNSDVKLKTTTKYPTQNVATSTPPKPQAKDESKFIVGAKVRHAKFGEGIITAIEKNVATMVVVDFQEKGSLKLLLNYAPIELI